MTLEEEFTAALRGTVEAARERKYNPAYFLKMLAQYGGLETAKRLIAKRDPQAGLMQLWELRLLNDSMEAVMLRSRFRSLFTDEELAEAKQRLKTSAWTRQRSADRADQRRAAVQRPSRRRCDIVRPRYGSRARARTGPRLGPKPGFRHWIPAFAQWH